MSQDPIVADPAVLADIRSDFETLGRELAEAVGPVRTDARRVVDGAGELADALADGVAAFELSWQVAFDATGDTAAALAKNVGGFSLDLQALDDRNS